jgi:hypothetical protein
VEKYASYHFMQQMQSTLTTLFSLLFAMSLPFVLEAQPSCAILNCTCGVPAQVTVPDGNFENPLITPSLIVTYGAGNSFGAWLVNSGQIDILDPNYGGNWASGNPNGASQFIDLHGLVPGTISTQLVGLIPNKIYTISIWYAKNPGAPSANCNITIANGAWLNQSWTATNNPASGWLQICFSFTALAATAELRLAGSGPLSAGGVLLDDITLWASCSQDDAGSFQSLNLIQACQNQSITLTHLGNQVLGSGSALSYVLVADSTTTLPANILQISPTPTFSFDPATMSVNTVYFVAAVAAPGAAGAPNWASNCIDLSYFASVVWKPVPMVAASGAPPLVCGNRCAEFLLNFTGAFPISLSWSVNLGSQTLTGIFSATSPNQILTICPPTGQSFPVGGLSLDFIGISDAFCVCP